MSKLDMVGLVRIFGYTPDIDEEETPADVWNGGSAYPFPDSAYSTVIVSDSAADDSDGTGARTAYVEGLDANYRPISETVSLNGTQQQALTHDYLRINDFCVKTAGSNGTNVGECRLVHSPDKTIARIMPAHGHMHQAIYTVPAEVASMRLEQMTASLWAEDDEARIELALQIRECGGAWRTMQIWVLRAGGSSAMCCDDPVCPCLPPCCDIRMRVLNSAKDNLRVGAALRLRS